MDGPAGLTNPTLLRFQSTATHGRSAPWDGATRRRPASVEVGELACSDGSDEGLPFLGCVANNAVRRSGTPQRYHAVQLGDLSTLAVLAVARPPPAWLGLVRPK